MGGADRVAGVVDTVIFQNEVNGYTVAQIAQPDGEELILVGVMPLLGPGETVFATGEMTSHPKYGQQFIVQSCRREMPRDKEDIFLFLSTHTIKGIGPKTARAIVDRFGSETFTVLAERPQELSKIKGITPHRAQEIVAEFVRRNQMKLLLEFLAEREWPLFYAALLFQQYGGEALERVRENPYLLCVPPFEGDFHQSDGVARERGVAPDSAIRLDAALLYELNFNLKAGHVFIPEDQLVAVSRELCEGEEEALYIRVAALEEQGMLFVDRAHPLRPTYLSQIYRCEGFIADEAARLCRMTLKPPARLEKMIGESERVNGITYAQGQRDAIRLCFESGLALITGGPGTGKTTALLTILELLKGEGQSVLLAAPTGKAAKRMSEACGQEAKTLHRLLEATFAQEGGMRFQRNRQNPLAADVVIVDEASMLELTLVAALLDALRPHTRLVLVGDADQLPPIGAGSVFADLLSCPTIPQVRLSEIFRQAQDSDIVMNAHRINRGELPELRNNRGDFYFSTARSQEAVVQTVLSLITERIPAHFGIAADEIQVICPSRKLLTGTVAMNQLLQQTLNPPAPQKMETRFGEAVFRTGDRVMQTRNNYDVVWRRTDGEVGAGVFNGDTGVILAIDQAGKSLLIRFDEREAVYSFSQLDELEHAFAITVHKAQGSEFRAVIMPVFAAPARLLNRCLLYTAVTRARELLILVGRRETLDRMVEDNRKNKRFGSLRRRFMEAYDG